MRRLLLAALLFSLAAFTQETKDAQAVKDEGAALTI